MLNSFTSSDSKHVNSRSAGYLKPDKTPQFYPMAEGDTQSVGKFFYGFRL